MTSERAALWVRVRDTANLIRRYLDEIEAGYSADLHDFSTMSYDVVAYGRLLLHDESPDAVPLIDPTSLVMMCSRIN